MNKVPMTVEGAEALRAELNDLKKVQRPRIIEAIAEAREHGDLKENAEIYFEVMRRLDKSGTIAHISEDSGQLDFLLALDGPDRKIFSYIEDAETRTILQNSYITQKYGKLHFTDAVSETLPSTVETVIISSEKMALEVISQMPNPSIKTIVLLKKCVSSQTENISTLGYQNVYGTANISIFKPSGNTAK